LHVLQTNFIIENCLIVGCVKVTALIKLKDCGQAGHFCFNPLTPTSVIMDTALKHPVPDRVKLSFVIFDIQALWRSGLSVRVPRCQKLQMTA